MNVLLVLVNVCSFRRWFFLQSRTRILLLLVFIKTVFFVSLFEIYSLAKWDSFPKRSEMKLIHAKTIIPTLTTNLKQTTGGEEVGILSPDRRLKTDTILKNKTILIWNRPSRIETSVLGFGHEPFVQHKCQVSQCTLYKKKSALPLDSYDAIIVHMHVLWMSKLPDFARRRNQRFIFFTQESPATMPIDVSQMGNIFNWTMTYRFNSDIQLLYGRISPRPTAPQSQKERYELIEKTHRPFARNYATNKTRLAVWMATHCDTPSLRETYVRQLSKFIQVDVYGGCGNLSCERNASHWLSHPKCYDMIEAKYKFYLSFENSLCNDYVTEKFFRIMERDVVPVVYGKANYSRIAPVHSYIDALQFTPQQLAKYLQLLDANDALYNEYFWWKGHYQVEAGVEQMARHGFCDLCKKLHHDEGVVKYYTELVSDWHPKNSCTHYPSWETEL